MMSTFPRWPVTPKADTNVYDQDKRIQFSSSEHVGRGEEAQVSEGQQWRRQRHRLWDSQSDSRPINFFYAFSIVHKLPLKIYWGFSYNTLVTKQGGENGNKGQIQSWLFGL